MKVKNTVINEDVKVEDIVSELTKDVQNEEIIGGEQAPVFQGDVPEEGFEVVELPDADENTDYQEFLMGQEGDTFTSTLQSSSSFGIFAQVDDDDATTPDTVDTPSDTPSVSAETLAPGGGGGLSPVDVSSVSGILGTDYRGAFTPDNPNETTAASSVSGLPGLDPNNGERNVDGLNPIEVEVKDFELSQVRFEEVTIANDPVPEEEVVVAEEPCEVMAEDDLLVLQGTIGTITYADLLINDTGTPGSLPLKVESVNGFAVPTSGTFVFNDGSNIVTLSPTGIQYEDGGEFSGSTLTIVVTNMTCSDTSELDVQQTVIN